MNWNPKVMQVIETHELRGKGVKGDPTRKITTYWTLEGQWLGEGIDSYVDECGDLFFNDAEKLKAFKEALTLIYTGNWTPTSGVGTVGDFAEEILKKYGEF